ncbi:hypothetical protein UFOVP721_11 [uncultured Caudovirales phage]|uniref:Uncharacterized protein n=1 Tax=uncultured Caudovirales phage TaxID=2100421 RepID=A0A6J5NRB2_9CAUD|nr:hypothetical protein UFOVP721_11 [uncultured Caudovirales phage]
MAKIIDTNRHGIRREIDHQYKPKKRIKKKLSTDPNKLSTAISTDIDISIVRSTDAPVMGANNVKRGN